MVFRTFRVQVVARLLLLTGLVLVLLWGLVNTSWEATPIVCGVLALLVVADLIRYVESTNRQLAGFLEFVSHHDFAVGVPIREKGESFGRLEAAYDTLASEFRHLNREKAANHRYLESLVEHISSALVCLDDHGTVTLMNGHAKELFGTPYLNSLKSFRRIDTRLPELIGGLVDGSRTLVSLKLADEPLQLALYATEFQLLGRHYKLISFQNIRDELEQREIDYSQKLIKVLTHEIMNSVTPIIALTKLVEDRLMNKDTGRLKAGPLDAEERDDLARSLASIESRGNGLLGFVQAYSSLTGLPRPKIRDVGVEALFDRVVSLMAPELEADGIELEGSVEKPGLLVHADPDQIEQVLINLVKNAAEALNGRRDGRIRLRAGQDQRGKVQIRVADNGTGIDPEKLEDIFVPFYTTKRKGSGVGLSVSRQIMSLNKGVISVKTAAGRGSEFTLRFR